MISVLFNWFYIAATSFLIGFGLAAFVRRMFHYYIKDIACIAALGLLTVTVYAQIFSLFYKWALRQTLFLSWYVLRRQWFTDIRSFVCCRRHGTAEASRGNLQYC